MALTSSFHQINYGGFQFGNIWLGNIRTFPLVSNATEKECVKTTGVNPRTCQSFKSFCWSNCWSILPHIECALTLFSPNIYQKMCCQKLPLCFSSTERGKLSCGERWIVLTWRSAEEREGWHDRLRRQHRVVCDRAAVLQHTPPPLQTIHLRAIHGKKKPPCKNSRISRSFPCGNHVSAKKSTQCPFRSKTARHRHSQWCSFCRCARRTRSAPRWWRNPRRWTRDRQCVTGRRPRCKTHRSLLQVSRQVLVCDCPPPKLNVCILFVSHSFPTLQQNCNRTRFVAETQHIDEPVTLPTMLLSCHQTRIMDLSPNITHKLSYSERAKFKSTLVFDNIKHTYPRKDGSAIFTTFPKAPASVSQTSTSVNKRMWKVSVRMSITQAPTWFDPVVGNVDSESTRASPWNADMLMWQGQVGGNGAGCRSCFRPRILLQKFSLWTVLRRDRD